MIRIILASAFVVTISSMPVAAPSPAYDAVFQQPYEPGEIDKIIAASPTVEDLVRAMLVGDDPQRVDALVEIIAGPDESAMVVAMADGGR